MKWLSKNLYGILVALSVAFVAYFLGRLFPLVGGAIFGIVLGIMIGNLMSLLNSVGLINEGMAAYCISLGKFLIILALSAIGLNSDFKKMMHTGFKPVLLGFAIWLIVASTSLIVQHAMGML